MDSAPDGFLALKNPSAAEIAALIEASPQRAARRIRDPGSGDLWYWDATLATHAEGAARLGIPYDLRPGEGDIVTLGADPRPPAGR